MAKIEIIDTGYFYADGGAMFGAVPKSAWARKYPADASNGCVLAMRSLLLTTADGRRMLIDTGAGEKHLRQLSYYRFFQLKDLREELRRRSVEPEEITDVVLTHLHFDHCGFCTRREGESWQLVFPNATHWVSEAQWVNFLHPHALERDSFFPEDLEAVEAQGKLKLLPDASCLAPDVRLIQCSGHTPGQLVPIIQTEQETVVFAGDVIPLVASVSPEWISAYDTQPLVSYEEKTKLLERATQEQWRMIYCHDAYTVSSRIKKTDSGLYLPVRDSLQRVTGPITVVQRPVVPL